MEEYQEVNEINLIDLMFYCLRKWRWIVVFMVLSAIVTGIYKYHAIITDNQIKKEEQLQIRKVHPHILRAVLLWKLRLSYGCCPGFSPGGRLAVLEILMPYQAEERIHLYRQVNI